MIGLKSAPDHRRRARYSALILHHVSCRWPDAQLIIHSPAALGVLSPEFLAQGFDAVLLAGSTTDRGDDWLRDLAGRPGFAPVVMLRDGSREADARAALQLGARAVLER